MIVNRLPLAVTCVAAIASASTLAEANDTRLPTDTLGQISGEICKVSINSMQSPDVAPPDPNTAGNPILIEATIKKSCGGVTMVDVISEASLAANDGQLWLVADATCLGNGGFVGGCTTGTFHSAKQGLIEVGANFDVGAIRTTVHYRGFFNSLKPGKWLIEIETAGDGDSVFGKRSIVVTGFKGGV
jgi:hypothetical protein